MTNSRMPRRWRVVLWIAAGLALLVGGLALALVLSTPSPPPDLASSAPPKEIPAGWVTSAQPADSAAELALPYVTAGRLALSANGKAFGEETYDLSIAEDGTTLHSSGRFWFKVVLATVQVSFEQSLEADANLRPVFYTAQFHAPLGMDRSVRAAIDGDRAFVEQAGKREEITIDRERTVTLGTFSTYTLLPRLFALRQSAGEASFQVIALGGPPSQDSSAAASGLPAMTVRYDGPAQLRAGNSVLDVDRYQISSPAGESDLYARGAEFLALHAGDEHNVLWAYRSDFFPDGIEIVGEAAVP